MGCHTPLVVLLSLLTPEMGVCLQGPAIEGLELCFKWLIGRRWSADQCMSAQGCLYLHHILHEVQHSWLLNHRARVPLELPAIVGLLKCVQIG